MKKNIKLSEKHADLIRQNLGHFKNELLSGAAQNLYGGAYGSVAGFSKAFGQISFEKNL